MDKTIKLLADQMKEDPRIVKAKQEILSVVEEYSKQITGIKKSDNELKVNYDKFIEEFGDIRGNNLYYPYLGSGIGHGPLVELADGSVKYDFITGIGVHYFGHTNLKVLSELISASLSDTVMQGNLQQNRESFDLSKKFLNLANKNGAGLDHCFFTSSGAMANENALKMIFQKQYPKNRVLAFEHCFMGRSMAMAQISDKALYRSGIPETLKVDYIPFFNPDDPSDSTNRAILRLRDHITRFPDQHAVMCLEMIQGEGGYNVGDKDFFKAIIAELKEHNITIMIDEIQTFGRITTPFAFQYFELDKDVDVVTVGKMTQVCATLFKHDYNPRTGLISQTFTSSSSAIASANVILDELNQGNYFGENGYITKLHNHFRTNLEDIRSRNPQWLNGPYGMGAMIAITPYDGSAEKAKKLSKELFEEGLMGFIAGSTPTRLRFLLPVLSVTTEDIDQACIILEKTMAKLKN